MELSFELIINKLQRLELLGDGGRAHREADNLLCEALCLDLTKDQKEVIIQAFKNVPKWYS